MAVATAAAAAAAACSRGGRGGGRGGRSGGHGGHGGGCGRGLAVRRLRRKVRPFWDVLGRFRTLLTVKFRAFWDVLGAKLLKLLIAETVLSWG